MKIRKVNCLIDFFSEEIPASMQLFLEKELNLLFEKVLNKVLLSYEKIEILSSPRHHCVLINNIDSVQKDRSFDIKGCLLYTSPSPRDGIGSRMPSSA